MSFTHPNCKAFSTASHWVVWLAFLLGALVFLGFSLWNLVCL